MDTLFTLATLAAAIRLAIPVAVAALGEVITERAGVLNLGLEGTMLFGALAGYLATVAGGTPWLGLGGGLAAGAACGAVLALLMVVVRADQIVTGLAFTLFAGSATTYLFEQSYTIGQAPPRIPSLVDGAARRDRSRRTGRGVVPAHPHHGRARAERGG